MPRPRSPVTLVGSTSPGCYALSVTEEAGARSTVGKRAGPWIVMRGGRGGRWGGELRRHYIFDRLALRTRARMVEDDRHPRVLRTAARGTIGNLPGAVVAALPYRGPRARLAASEKLRPSMLEAARRFADPTVVAIYDDPVAQSRALGVVMAPEWAAEVARRQERTITAFRWLVVPTASFADLIGLDRDRVIVGGNGTDTGRIRSGPWPVMPTVGVVSAAAPGRGLEMLIEAARLTREVVPDLLLRMWLVAMSASTADYLASLRRQVAEEPWVVIGTAPYDRLGEALISASVLTIPHPPNEYLDVALPVKLFDSAAAGRPLLVTPRTETAAVVREHEIGVVAAGDTPADVAASLVGLLRDEPRMHSLGAHAREVAERHFDWHVVGDRIAENVLRREGDRH